MNIRFAKVTALPILLAMGAGASERVAARGQVVAADGKPIEHATVLVYEARTKSGYSVYCPTCWVDCGKRTVTDADGKYSISGLNSDLIFKLLIVRKGYRAVFVDKVDPSVVPASSVVLNSAAAAGDPSQAVLGRVVDDHGDPVKDAVIEQQGVRFSGPHGSGRAFGPDDSPDWIQPLAATDEQGEFEIIYAKPAVDITLNVSPRAMAPKLVSLATGADRKTVIVAQGATIRGRLLRPDGTPAANAEIGVFVHGRMAGNTFPEVRIGTKDDGTFAITNIPAGRIWYVYPKMESLADSGLAGDAVVVETKDDGEEMDVGTLRLRAGFTLRGKIALSDGKPMLAGMHVTLSSDLGLDSQIAPVQEDGSFEFRGLSKGVYSIAPGVKGYRLDSDLVNEVLVSGQGKTVLLKMSPALNP